MSTTDDEITDLAKQVEALHPRETPFVDLRDPRFVEVVRCGDRLYVHVNGATVLRIYGVKSLHLEVNDEPRRIV